MKVIVAGSRNINNMPAVRKAVEESGFEVTEIVSGMARGVDTLAIWLAREYGVPLKGFPADWGREGKLAGFKRNQEMARYADALVAIWDGFSKGTKHMIDTAQHHGLKVHVAEHGAAERLAE